MKILWRDNVVPADSNDVHILVGETGVFSAEEIEVAVELVDDKLSHPEHSTYQFQFAESGGRVIGYICYGRIPLTDGRYDLYWVVIDSNRQQQGIAKKLLGLTEKSIRKQGGGILYAETSSRAVYAPAQEFYHKSGFTELARLKDFYRGGDDKLIFGKII